MRGPTITHDFRTIPVGTAECKLQSLQTNIEGRVKQGCQIEIKNCRKTHFKK